MPKVTVLRGEIQVTGRRYTTVDGEKELYNRQVYVYADTIGALLDLIAAESINVTKHAKAFVKQNMPPRYDMTKDHWYSSISHPYLLEEDNEYDWGSGSAISKLSDIVRRTANSRQSSITYALESINKCRKNMGLREFPLPEELSYSVSKVIPDEDLLKHGIVGAAFDKFLAIAEADGSLKTYRFALARQRGIQETLRLERVYRAKREQRRKDRAKNSKK